MEQKIPWQTEMQGRNEQPCFWPSCARSPRARDNITRGLYIDATGVIPGGKRLPHQQQEGETALKWLSSMQPHTALPSFPLYGAQAPPAKSPNIQQLRWAPGRCKLLLAHGG